MPPSKPHRIPHYIGITGVQSISEVERLIPLAHRYGIHGSGRHTLMLGVLVSPSTLPGERPTLTSKPCRHVANKEHLVDILRAVNERGVVGMIHFELHKEWPGTAGDAASVISLLSFLKQHGVFCPVQLNGVVLPHEVLRISNETDTPIVLQLRKELSTRSRQELLAYIGSIEGVVSKILMDPSAGAGEAIAVEGAMQLYREIESRFPDSFTFGFAGGLGGAANLDRQRTTDTVREIISQIPTGAFSLDSETKVRRVVGNSDEDVLDIELCEVYLSTAQAGFSALE